MADLTGGDLDKFLVLKREDIEDYLYPVQKYKLNNIVSCVENGRRIDKRKQNKYLVINVDEPYADEIIEILKRNGHWG